MNRRTFAETTLKGILGLGVVSGTKLHGATNSALVDSVIYIYMDGGMTHLDTFDPKSHENAGDTKILETDVPGLKLGHHLTQLSKFSKNIAVVNSLNSQTGAHRQGQYLMKTSYKEIATIVHPTLGSWASYYDSNRNTALPSYVAVRRPSRHPGSGWMPAKNAPVDITDPNKGLEYSKLISKDSRLTLLDEMNRKFKPNSSSVKAYSDFYDEAFKLVQSSDLDAFDLDKEDAAMRDAYGRDQFGQGLLLSRRLIERGVKFVEITNGGWDTHTDNFTAMNQKLPLLDSALSTLLKDLTERGLLERTLIVIATEFGRTPRINVNTGRDHWPAAFSGALIGGSISPQAYGKTDDGGEKVLENPVSIEEFNGTIAYGLGLPLETPVSAPSGRPFVPSNHGKPITSLFA